MAYEYIEETDPDEVEHSKYIPPLFKRAAGIREAMEGHESIDPDSVLGADDVRAQGYPVSEYAYSQLSVAVGCIDALERMIIRESEKSIQLEASPFGAHALIRNAIDAAAVALWLLEPESSTGRVKRRFLLAVDEVSLGAKFRRSMGRTGVNEWKKEKRARIRGAASNADLNPWNPLKEDLPTTTAILEKLERLHEHGILPWLSAWQLTSGQAHGKMWAYLASSLLDEVQGSRTESGSASYRMTIHYGLLAVFLLETVRIIEAAWSRYLKLARA